MKFLEHLVLESLVYMPSTFIRAYEQVGSHGGVLSQCNASNRFFSQETFSHSTAL